MKKIAFSILAACTLFTLVAFAAGIDGKWALDLQRPNRGGGQGGYRGRGPMSMVLDLKSDGNTLTGTVVTKFGDNERTSDIKDGKLDGNKFSFSTTSQRPDGDVKTLWSGTLDGDTMKGERTREGSDRSMPFTGKRQ